MRVKFSLLFSFLILVQMASAQKQVTNLHYTYTEKNAKKPDGILKYEFNFNYDPAKQIFVADKVNEKGKTYPRHIIDYNKKVTVVQMEKRNEYLLEESDSFWVNNQVKLKPVAETKELKGFKCHGYTFSSELKINAGGPLGNASILEDYTLWVTDDLQFNEESNNVILALLRTQSVRGADFKGVLVQMDCKMTFAGKVFEHTISLDDSKFEQKPEAVKWPWESSDAVAWIEQPQLTSSTTVFLGEGWKRSGVNGGVYREGDGSVEKMNKRLKALLVKITGQENPKTKWVYFQNNFGVGPWGN